MKSDLGFCGSCFLSLRSPPRASLSRLRPPRLPSLACCTPSLPHIRHFLNRDALAAALSGPEGLSVAYTMHNDHSTSWRGTHRLTLTRIHTVMPCITRCRSEVPVFLNVYILW